MEMSEKMKIKIIGIGGGGCNSINRLSKRKENFGEIEFYAANTDTMALSAIPDDVGVTKIKLGENNTHGNGAGADPRVGRAATEESKDEIAAAIGDAKLLFVIAGMGKGTGTGGAPVVAQIAREKQILTIGVVTTPFLFEGEEKFRIANEGINEMRKYVDIMIVVSNQKAIELCGPGAPMTSSLEKADEVLINSIKGITDILVHHYVVNLDLADISTIIKGKKSAHIGLGSATGENRMFKALKMACNNDLLNTTIDHAKNIMVSIVMDDELPAGDVQKALSLIPKVVAENAKIIHGFGSNSNLKQEVHVTIIATGLPGDEIEEEEDVSNEPHEPGELIEETLLPKNEEKNEGDAQESEEEITPIDNLIRVLQNKK